MRGRKTWVAFGAAVLGILLAVVPLGAFVFVPPLAALSASTRKSFGRGAALMPWAVPFLSLTYGDPLPAFAACAGLGIWGVLTVLGKRDPKVCCGIAMLTAILVTVGLLLVWSAASHADFGTLASDYVYVNADRPLFRFWARHAYARTPNALSPGHPGYRAAALDALASAAADEMSEYAFYYALGYAALTAAAAYLLYLVAVGRRGQLKNLRLDRRYLLYVFLPVAAFSLLGLVPRFLPLTAAVFYAAVTAPCAVCGTTLMLYAAACFTGRARVPAICVAVTLAAVLYTFGWGQMILCFIGFADVLLPLRKLIDLAAE